nr:replication protein A 70 kDa DNA-binding subunit B [Tanacetum cinerariifolium]
MVGSIGEVEKGFHCILYARIIKIHHKHGWAYLAFRKRGNIAKQTDAERINWWNSKLHGRIIADGVVLIMKLDPYIIFESEHGLKTVTIFRMSMIKHHELNGNYMEKQHVLNVLNSKPFKTAFLEFVELVIISTYNDLIQMLVVMPFDDLKLCDSDDSTFGVDILSRFPTDHKFIELLTFAPPIRDSPESMFVIANRLLQERIQASLDSCMILSSARRLDWLIVQKSECLL